MANEVRVSASLKDEISDGLGRIRDRVDQMGKGITTASLIGNAGAMALQAGFGLVQNAIGNVTQFIGDSIDAYRQEQVSIAGLTAALESNVPAWDAHNNAIETTIAQREKLGFSDDAQREGLKILLAATHDSTDALEAQAVAMDLARFRGIDLSTASDLVAKAWNGNTTSLKKLGIELTAGTSGMAALNAITRVTGGQAQKFADTDLGKAQAAAISVDNTMEKVGETFSHLSAAILPAAAKAFEDVVESLTHTGLQARLTEEQYNKLLEKINTGPSAMGLLGDAVGWLGDQYAKTTSWEAELNKKLDEAAPKIKAAKADQEKLAQAVAASSDAIEDIALKSDSTALAVVSANRRMVDAWTNTRDAVIKAADDIIGDAYDPLIRKQEIVAAEAELAEARQKAASDGLTASEKANADLRVLELEKELARKKAAMSAFNGDMAAAAAAAGVATGEQFVAGLMSSDPAVAQHYRDLQTALDTATQAAATAAMLGGEMLANAWIDGVATGILSGSAEISGAISTSVGSQMIGFSPPKSGPLSKIDQGGENIGEAWLEGLAKGIGGGPTGALARIAALMVGAPGQAQGGLSTAAGSLMGGGSLGSLPPVHVYLDGREVARSVARWSRLGDGRSQYLP